MEKKKKEFIQNYINQLQQELDSFSEGNSDESSVFDIIVEIKGVFAADFPDLDANLSFNNGSAIRDAKIVLGLLNKVLIEDFDTINSSTEQEIFLENIKQLKLEIGSFKSTILSWTKVGNIGNYLDQLEIALDNMDLKSIKYCLKQAQDWYNQNIDRLMKSSYNAHKLEHKTNYEKINQFVTAISQIPDNYVFQNETADCKNSFSPIIFISHSSADKKYGDALRNFIIGLGVKNKQLVYTSHPLHKIPAGQNIYNYLRSRINNHTFMLFLFSKNYLDSTACLNEMGAAWLAQTEYLNFYTPNFDFGDNKYLNCAIDKNQMGIKLENNDILKVSMIEFKNKLVELFKINPDEATVSNLIDNFINEIQ